ncbi:MAG TPA: asparagine synthase-related protein [Bacteroidales bacterium]|nr:asparagine synthase-related protein [Bacteroidales bacterium]
MSLSGKPVEPGVFGTMRNALNFYNPDKSFEWKSPTVALGCLMRFDTPESFNEQYPLFDATKNIIFMASCRIDNRDELNSILNIPYEQRATITDGALMFNAYLKWGENACDHLLGDWSFLAYHQLENKLILARDHCGITALYYTQLSELLVFSSSPKALLALSIIPKTINELRIAQILTAWPGNGEDTCYEGIYNLLPGHYLKIENRSVQKIKFWELVEQDDLILPNEQDYYDRFLELFTNAVKARLRTTKNVGIMLSGGLDSTSIAAIAAIELAKQNKELYAFTSVPLYKDYTVPKHRNGDEGELAGEMAKMYPNIRHFLVNAEGYDPIEAVNLGVEIFDEPIHAASNLYWIQAINDKAKESNVDVLLTGQGGNGVISWPSNKIALYNNKGYQYYKHRLGLFVRNNREAIIQSVFHKYPFLKYSDINLSFAKELNLLNKMKEAGHDPSFTRVAPFKTAQMNLISSCFKNAYSLHFRKNIWFGINSLDSTADKRLLDYSCSIPQYIYANNQYNRILVRKGLKHIFPIKVLEERKKGLQASDISTRLNYSSVQNILDNYLNNGILKRIINIPKIKSSGTKELASHQHLIRTFSSILILNKIYSHEY